MLRALLLSLPAIPLASIAFAPSPQDPADDPPARESEAAEVEITEEEKLYPPWPNDALLRFYLVKGDLDEERLDEALTDLDADTYLLEGPKSHKTRPSSAWIAVEQSAVVTEKDLLKAVKRGRAKVEEAHFTLIEWVPHKPPSGKKTGGDLIKQALNIHGDVVWVDNKGDYLAFFYTGKKLDGEEIMERFSKLWSDQAQDPAKLELEVVEDTIVWPLVEGVDEKEAKKGVSAALKLDGVLAAEIDVEGLEIELTVRLDRLSVSGTPGSIDGGGIGTGLRYTYDVNPLIAALEEVGVHVDDE